MREYEQALYRLLSDPPPRYGSRGLLVGQIRDKLPIPVHVLGGANPYAFLRARQHLFKEVSGGGMGGSTVTELEGRQVFTVPRSPPLFGLTAT